MIVKTIQVAGASVIGLSLSFGLVSAQGAPPVRTEASESPSEQDAVDTRTPEQILADARASLDKMEAAADNVGRMLRQSREAKDVVKTLCLDDKLNQMNVATRSAADRVAGIEAAAQAGNAERVGHDNAVLEALAARGGELSAEANQCIGEERGTLGATELEVTIDPAIPKEDTATPATPIVISSPPIAASPTI